MPKKKGKKSGKKGSKSKGSKPKDGEKKKKKGPTRCPPDFSWEKRPLLVEAAYQNDVRINTKGQCWGVDFTLLHDPNHKLKSSNNCYSNDSGAFRSPGARNYLLVERTRMKRFTMPSAEEGSTWSTCLSKRKYLLKIASRFTRFAEARDGMECYSWGLYLI